PWISTGFEYFEFLSKTDLYDRNGNKYFYWSDGSIKNMAQGSPGSQNAINLVRDYTYESDIREMNPYGFGKYQEYSFAVPVGAGFLFHLNDRVDFKMGTTFHFTFTDYIDGGSNKFTGNKSKDKFMMTSFSLHYDLVTKKKDDTLSPDHFKDVDFYALEMEDEDGDGVRDFDDMCHETPKGVKVDAKGCPLDEDGDGIPDYRDDELPTPKSMIANGRGVGITDAMAQLWYDTFYDSTGIFAKQVDLDSARNAPKENLANKQREYTVELAKFKGGVPNDVMTFLLSIGDIRSTTIGDTTIVYTAGSYEDVRTAVRRKDEFVSEGVKDAKVGYFQGGKYNELSKDELGKEIAKANEKSGNNGNEETNHVPGAIIYRIQLGAFKNKLSPNVFKNAGKVLELKTDDGFYRYVSGAHKTLNSAAAQRADLVFEGYPDAWITAYKNGKRISLTEAGATYENKNDSKQENLNDSKNSSSSVDKNLIAFRLQLGIKKDSDLGFKDRIKDLKGVEKQVMSTGDTRYLLEKNYSDYNEAMKVKAEMNTNGFPEVIVIATFKGEIIPTLDALELLTK
ncbi:MAG TPA: SPOR domain-containing protein, partial [Nitrosopumilaceae archaeon]|nr:SPOR domain-containing protein [Nitrosopumilaceae archaeon]